VRFFLSLNIALSVVSRSVHDLCVCACCLSPTSGRQISELETLLDQYITQLSNFLSQSTSAAAASSTFDELRATSESMQNIASDIVRYPECEAGVGERRRLEERSKGAAEKSKRRNQWRSALDKKTENDAWVETLTALGVAVATACVASMAS
jgi:hypothetical protein